MFPNGPFLSTIHFVLFFLEYICACQKVTTIPKYAGSSSGNNVSMERSYKDETTYK